MKKEKPAISDTKVVRRVISAGNGNGAKDAKRVRGSGKNLTHALNRFFAQEHWPDARALLEKELARLRRLPTASNESPARRFEKTKRELQQSLVLR